MSNASNKKLELLKQHFPPNQSLNQPDRPQFLEYLKRKLPLNHPLIQILEEML
ncbi:hypothetical protein [Peribacillus butanolivorans]|uniref:hypothetical protein n=1 Tax=Peribacillus butanolivorans TaxID=421767 RepID=UPI0036DABB97